MVKTKTSGTPLRTGKEKRIQKRQTPKQKSDAPCYIDSTSKHDLPYMKHDSSEIVPIPNVTVSKQSSRKCDPGSTPNRSQINSHFSRESPLVELTPSKGTVTEGVSVINCSYGTPVVGFVHEKNDMEISFSQTSSDQDCELREVVTEIISDLSNENGSSKENHPSASNENGSSKENHPSASGGQESSVPEVPSDVVSSESSTLSVLEGVVAYVEVRTEFEDTSRSVEKQLLRLGAKVSKMNKKVTHIVFMNGRLSTQKKGISQGCHMVSVLWVEMCRQKKERVPEHLYPALLEDEDDDPLFPKKRKRFRCIQPKKFKDEFAASAERLKEIFSRVKTVTADSVVSSLTSTPAIVSDNSEEIKVKKSKDLEEKGTPVCQDRAPRRVVQKRKLFSNSSPLCSSAFPATDFEDKPGKTKFLENMELKDGTGKHVEHISSNSISEKNLKKDDGENISEMVNGNCDLLEMGKKPESDFLNLVKETDSNNNRTNSKKDKWPVDNSSTSNGASNVGKRKRDTQPQRKTVKQRANNNEKQKTILPTEDSTACNGGKSKTVPSHGDSENASKVKNSELRTKSCPSSNEKPNSHENTSGHCDNAVRDNVSNEKVPSNAELNCQQNTVHPKLLRDQGNLQKNPHISPVKCTSSGGTLKKHVEPTVSPKKTCDNVDKSENVSHSSLDDFKDVENRHVTKKLKIATVSNVAKKISSKTSKKKTPGRIVITSVPVNEEESLRSIIKSLGSFTVSETVTGSTTHVICGEKKRTLKVIFGIALGCWLVSPEWVFKSLEAGSWLKEDPFELAEHYPAVQLSRMERYTTCSSYKRKLFQELGLIYISPCCNPPREKLTELVTMVGGKVTSSLKRCAIIVGTGEAKINGTRVVSEKWIFDCITRNEIIPITS